MGSEIARGALVPRHRSPARRTHRPVHGHEIAAIVSAWLAELGAHSPLVDDLARAARVGDWAAAYAVADQLSVDVTVAAEA